VKASEATLIKRIKSRNDDLKDASEADSGVLEILKVVEQTLQQHELAHTVELINEADKSSIPAAVEWWDQLEVLIEFHL
jgi:hypothetical protein